MKLLKQKDLWTKRETPLKSLTEEFQDFVREYFDPSLTEEDFVKSIDYGKLEGFLPCAWALYCGGVSYANERQYELSEERRKEFEQASFVLSNHPLGLALYDGKVQPTYGKEILNVATCDLVQTHSEIKVTCTFIVPSIANEKDKANGS